ncbi:MAG: GGDEF domain-containing protein [Gammaproteobacteria bacterium]|nr:MAG: GGDEF domain-containing protein [Gammaproteobacteria bacterium]
MAERSDDKSANWREKYLDALDQQDQIEKSLGAQQELLRRALVRVSVAADGQDDALDGVLSQLRERMRGSITGDISNLLARLDEVALNFEQHREQNSQDVRQSLTETIKPLQELDLSRGVKKEISQYLSQLPERSRKVRLYPALLQQLANIQQQALKEIEQPKTGFLQKILGTKNPEKENEKPTLADISLSTPETNLDITAPSFLDKEKPPVNYAQLNSELQNGANADASKKNTESVALVTAITEDNINKSADHLPQKFIDQITQVINQFLIGLEKEAPMVKKVQVIRERLNAARSADAFIKTLESLRDLVTEAYLSANQAFATYLKNVNQELADIYSVVGGAVESESNRRNASNSLQDSMRKGMETLESNAESATDLAQLKNLVQSQIGNIRQALDHFQQSEQEQNQLAGQLEALATKIKVMEDEAEKNRSVLEKQRYKALHDPLTELPNREYYNERASYEYQRWQRYHRPLTLAVFDIDHFKKINDTHGHQAGDRVLKVIGRSVAKRLREVDFFCRFGGEEFVALMPETSLGDAMPVLDAIRAAIANASFNYKEQPISITLSVGVTCFNTNDDLETAFARADEALYAAKSGGRNCIKSA